VRIAWREMRASRAKFLFVVLSVAIGVGSLTGVRGFSSSFRHALLGEARTLMAGDLTARVFSLPTPEQEAALRSLDARGVRRTWITETVTMAGSASTPDPLLTSVKAVDPAAYPYYGVVKLNPPRPLREALDAFVNSTQENVTGSVTLSLYKGNVSIVSRKSEFSQYRTDLSSFTMSESYDQKDAAGFIRILGLPSRSRAQARMEVAR